MTDIAELESQASELELAKFDHSDAWELGTSIREGALQAGLRVAIDIRRASGAVLFRASFPGLTADLEDWIDRKSALAFRFEESSALVTERMASFGLPEGSTGWLDPARYVLAGGAVPIKVTGAGVVAVVTVSGASSAEDHALIVEGIRTLKAA
ncbi:heme-binding protein [Pseudarthrobacter sp. R1]|uniref:heme-binding protein n=1 Tax=Pseudarthrobacter sp. R1 TaxID=2944934 RepID=UPI00210E1782|nr:heme-binding protein [Pseudarthrobacter sp. R1]MCQ6271030.1 heme-binding protein [Pseudarthrobacter sp. R1]